ncbi:MAG: HesB/IscA family protein [Chloroflexota bacterium]|nr:MAG: hypothetical protein DLM70_15070 [Chloroflexota bacterium]
MINITVSPRAADELKKALGTAEPEQTVNGVRVMVQSACGCGTAHFAMGFDDAQPEDDRIDLGGVTLLIDPDSAPYLENAEVDYSDDLMQKGFRINAPQSSGGGGCGCGGHGHSH